MVFPAAAPPPVWGLVVVAIFACVAVATQHQVSAGACEPAEHRGLTKGIEAEHVLLQRRSALSLAGSGQPAEEEEEDEEEDCHTVLEGEPCYAHVHWAWIHGIYSYPQWYPGLTTASSFEDFQAYLHAREPELCPMPCTAGLRPSAGEVCVSRAVSLDFFNAELSHNNLGGLGPDPGSADMRYKHVGNRSGQPFDLVVAATSPYTSAERRDNGLARGGKYGIINLKSGASVDFTFSFVDSVSSAPVVLEAFHFSFLDIDQSRTVTERIYVGGFENYTLFDPTDVAVDLTGERRAVFKSTRFGGKCDNPRDPLSLGEVTCRSQTVNQKSRAVTLLFSNMSSFSVTMEAACGSRRGCRRGRHFLFAGSSSLASSCEEAPRLGLCAAFGDPHFVTFDGAHTVIMEEKVIWLVHSRDVWIQALSKGSAGNFQGLAIGGAFLGNRTLLVVKDTAFTLRVSLDGADILTDAVDEFVVPGVIEGYRSERWNATLHNEEILKVRTQIQFSVGPWPERFLEKPVGGLFLFKLPGSVEVTVTGVDWMSVVITMPQQPGGQGGYCGDFDGQPHNDFEPRGLSFHKPVGSHLEAVEASQVLFGPDLLQPSQGVHASQLDPEVVVEQCNPALKTTAEQRCRQVTDARLRDDCVFDVCATGLISAAEGILSAEILEEKVNARGIPLFRGLGQCLDSAGERYVAFNTSLTTLEECTDVLRSLALTWGVAGAQIYMGSACQILAQNGTDPTHVSIRGGWGPRAELSGQGIGTVSDTDGEESWGCWELV